MTQGIDQAVFQKIYGNEPTSEKPQNPGCVPRVQSRARDRRPNPKHISRSYVERQKLTMRMLMRRFTRATKAFSEKVENHCVVLYFIYNNVGRVHQTLQVTPAMEAGVASRF